MSNSSFESPRILYRSRNGWIFGICKGLAHYSGIASIWIRTGAVIALFLSGIWPMLLIYIMAAIFIKPEPVIKPKNIEDWEFYNSYITDRKMGLLRIRNKFNDLDRRTRRLETIVTSPEYRWNQKLNS